MLIWLCLRDVCICMYVYILVAQFPFFLINGIWFSNFYFAESVNQHVVVCLRQNRTEEKNKQNGNTSNYSPNVFG